MNHSKSRLTLFLALAAIVTLTASNGHRCAAGEKDEKAKLCGGHLKRWYYMSDVLEQDCGDVEKAWGPNAEVYRCEYCKTLYLPNPEDVTGVNVAGPGQVSVFGLTLPGKEQK